MRAYNSTFYLFDGITFDGITFLASKLEYFENNIHFC